MADLPETKGRIERGEALRRADIAPGSLVLLASQLAGGKRAIEQRLQRRRARLTAVEQSRIEDRKAGIRQRRRRGLDMAIRAETVVAAGVMRRVSSAS